MSTNCKKSAKKIYQRSLADAKLLTGYKYESQFFIVI